MAAVVLGVLAAIGAFVAVSALVDSREAAKVEDLAVDFAGSRPLGRSQPRLSLREQLNRPFAVLSERASRRNVSAGRPTLAEQLGRAGLTLRTGEWVLIRVGCAALLALLGLLRFGVGLQFLILAVLGYFAPGFYLRYRQRKRSRMVADQLVDTVGLLSSALKAGHSFPQAVDTVAKNGSPPISEEFGRVVREMNLGGSTEQALLKMVRRLDSDDFDLIVTAVLIHQSIGGNLSRILDSISNTLRERVRLKGEISAITAQARASGWIITFLPVVVGGMLYVIAPTYFKPMVQTPLGWALLIGCGIAIGAGNAMIRRITRIEI